MREIRTSSAYTACTHCSFKDGGVSHFPSSESSQLFSRGELFFPISIFISAGNMPSRFFRRRRRHAPKSFPNNLERCAARAEDDGRFSPFHAAIFTVILCRTSRLSVPPPYLPESCRSASLPPQCASSKEGQFVCSSALPVFPVDVHILFSRKNYGSRTRRCAVRYAMKELCAEEEER